MNKDFTMRERHLFGILISVVTICLLTGCSPKVTTNTYIHEAGEKLPENVAVYAEFKQENLAEKAVLDVSEVETDQAGSYEAAIKLEEKEYSFTIEVVDTTEPEGTLKEHFIATSDMIKVEDFLEETSDCSEFVEGFRNIELIFDEVKVQELLVKEIGNQLIPEVAFDMDKIFETEYSADTHLWAEKDVEYNGLEAEIHPMEDGVYRMELAVVDIYGNASVAKVYAMVDTKAPVFTSAEDIEIEVSEDFDEYLKSFEEGLAAEDNLLGDMTTAIFVEDSEMLDSVLSMRVTYTVSDFAGNTASAERTIKVKENQPTVSAKTEDSTKAAQARAVAQQIADSVSGNTDLEKIRNAAERVAEYCQRATYTTEDPDYRTAYGVFCKGVFTCAGATRAMGLVLDCMDYSWEHVNPNQWTHQWCRVTMDGQVGWADGQAGAGYGEHPWTYAGTYTDTKGTVWSWN